MFTALSPLLLQKLPDSVSEKSDIEKTDKPLAAKKRIGLQKGHRHWKEHLFFQTLLGKSAKEATKWQIVI